MIDYSMLDWEEINPVWEKFSEVSLLDEIHVIRVRISKNIDQVLNQKGLLSQTELEKLDRIVQIQDKNIFLTSTVMKKTLCALFLNCKPQAVKFEKNEFNKPLIKDSDIIHFNTTHSGDWVIFIFSANPCGIDIERINYDFDFSGVLKMSFHRDEIDFVQNASDKSLSFFQIWTIKESILKAQGTGLMDNLHELNTLQDFSNLPTGTDQWQTKCFKIEEKYWCSLCFKNPFTNMKFFEF